MKEKFSNTKKIVEKKPECERSTMMLKKLQYIGTRIYSLDTMYPKKETDRGVQGEKLEEKKKERKRNKKTQFS